MKLLRWVVVGLLAIGIVAVVGLALWVPRLLDQPEVRQRIADGARQVTGRELVWDSLDIAWLPPGLEVTDAVLEPAGDEAPLGAERIALRVALLPLLGGTIVVDSLEVDGATLELVRSEDGIELPIQPPETEDEPRSEREAATEPPAFPADAVVGGDDDPISLAVRSIALRDSRVVLIDRTAGDARIALTELQADAQGGLDLDAPIPFEVAARLESGGMLRVTGEASLAGIWSAKVELAGLELEPLSAWVEDVALRGSADVVVEAEGREADVARLDVAFDGAGLGVSRDELAVSGAMALKLTLTADGSGGFAGPVELDLDDAGITLGDSLAKPSGDALALEGSLAWDGQERLALTDARVTLPGLIASVDVQATPVLRARVSTPIFDPAPLAAWVPALADAPVTGRIGLEDWTVALDPLSLGGGLHLEAVRIPLEAGHEALVSGMVEGQGDSVVGTGLLVRVADQPLTVSLRADGLDSSPIARVEIEGKGLDSAALLAALGGPDDSLSGPLDLTALLTAPLDSDEDVSQVARGRARFSIAPGRLRGVSLLRSTFDAFGAFGEVALFAGQAFGGSTLQRFYGDDFERFSGGVVVAEGVARTSDLRLDYRSYRADLAGTYRLADQAIDMTGQLTLFEQIDQAITDATPAPSGTRTPVRAVDKVIPLARVTGTLDDPKVRLDRPAVLSFTRGYLGGSGKLGQLQDKVDDVLGEGAGEAVFDVLEGILGGGRREER